MKNSPLEELISHAGTEVQLSASERARMRAALTEYMAFRPMRTTEPEIVTYQTAIGRIVAYARRPAFVLAAVVLVVALSGSGIAYAAEGSLPGDALYPIKVSVTEPLRTALIASPQAQAAWQQTLAERRLDEGAALAHEGKLSTTTETVLAAHFTEHATAAATFSATSSPAAGFALVTFPDRLAAYKSVLAQAGTSTTAILAHAVDAQIVRSARTTADDADAVHLQFAAHASLDTSARLLGSIDDTLSASSSQNAHDAFAQAQALTERGNALLQHEDASGASQAFQGALSATARLNVLTHAASVLHIDAFETASPPVSTTSNATTTSFHADTGHREQSDRTSPVSSLLFPSVEASSSVTTAVGDRHSIATTSLPIIVASTTRDQESVYEHGRVDSTSVVPETPESVSVPPAPVASPTVPIPDLPIHLPGI